MPTSLQRHERPSTSTTSRRTVAPSRESRESHLSRAVVGIVLAMLAMLASAMVPVRADELQDVSKLVAGGKLDDAEKKADAFLAKTPKDAQMRFLKGVILAQRGKRDEAVATFTGITQDYPELPEPYNNLAVIYAAQGQYDNARMALETSIRVAPNYATAYENLGDVYAALAARSYQDARRNDGSNAAALRKLNATRALLAGPSAAKASTPAATPSEPATGPAAEAVRSQRNVGLPSPAGPRITVGGSGAVAPDIVVPTGATQVPQGSNVVAIEEAPAPERRTDTSTLAGAQTVVAPDPAQPGSDIAAVTEAVERWARAKPVTTDNLRVRIDGDTAVARFSAASFVGRKRMVSKRALTLKRSGATWTVTDERNE